MTAGNGRLDLSDVMAADAGGRLQALFTLRLPQPPAQLTALPFLCGPALRPARSRVPAGDTRSLHPPESVPDRGAQHSTAWPGWQHRRARLGMRAPCALPGRFCARHAHACARKHCCAAPSRGAGAGRASLGPVGADGALQAHSDAYSLSGTCDLVSGGLVVGVADTRVRRVRPEPRAAFAGWVRPSGCRLRWVWRLRRLSGHRLGAFYAAGHKGAPGGRASGWAGKDRANVTQTRRLGSGAPASAPTCMRQALHGLRWLTSRAAPARRAQSVTGCRAEAGGPPQAHGIVMALAWVLVVPASVVVARFCRRLDPLWFRIHRALGCAGRGQRPRSCGKSPVAPVLLRMAAALL